MADHVDITDDAELHEPKGLESANVGEVYRADGSGSGSWVRPLELISQQDLSFSSETSLDITGLSAYRELVLVLENSNFNGPDELLLNFYSTSGATWRTSTSDYLNGAVAQNFVRDNGSYSGLNGAFITYFTSGIRYAQAISRISNFNNPTEATFVLTQAAVTNTYYPSVSTVATDELVHNSFSLTAAEEAHEGIRFRMESGGALNSMSFTLWGIR